MNLNIKTKYSPEPEELLAPENKNNTFKKGIRIMKKNMKKVMALALAASMTLGMTTVGMAQTVRPVDASQQEVDLGDASITITNAAKGETYKVYKLFDATVTGTSGGSIAYQHEADIPSGGEGENAYDLNMYFEKDSKNNVFKKDAAVSGDAMSSELNAALKLWADDQGENYVVKAESNGSELRFDDLPYGYYVVTSTQGTTGAITVWSTNPTATIVDKNSTTPSGLTKTSHANTGTENGDVFIGETVTYTVTFKTSNYDGAGADAEEILKYTIEDTTVEDFLSDINVTSIIVDNDADSTTTEDQVNITSQFVNNKIDIDWYDENAKQFRYDNGAEVTIVYTAKVTDNATIDSDGNTNKVTLTWTPDNGKTPTIEKLEEQDTIYTYALALKKVNDDGTALAGATFEFPFYVKEAAASDGSYIYAGLESGTGLTNTLTTPASGEITIKGVEAGTYSVTETVAPNGYNKLTAPFSVTAAKIGETAINTNTTVYIDEDGNITDTQTQTTKTVTYTNDNFAATVEVVVNRIGAELPSTGGMGTTIFYILGSIMALGAGVILFAKKRMGIEE